MPEKVRKFFIPRPGYVFLYADFSQVQSRILAHIAGDENYINLFCNGEDIHSLMASQIFDIPIDLVIEEKRTAAKKIVHGITNSEGAARIASDLKISKTLAQGYINGFYKKFPNVEPCKEWNMAWLRKHNFVESIMGRRSYYDMANILSPDKSIRGSNERSAFISILQMNEADIIKKTILAVDADQELSDMGVKMLFSVHDSLLVEAREEYRDEAAMRLKKIMEGIVELSVPLQAKVEWGHNWGALEPVNGS